MCVHIMVHCCCTQRSYSTEHSDNIPSYSAENNHCSGVQYVRLAAGRRIQAGHATDRAIAQWPRRLECVVQQQGGYIEHLM